MPQLGVSLSQPLLNIDAQKAAEAQSPHASLQSKLGRSKLHTTFLSWMMCALAWDRT